MASACRAKGTAQQDEPIHIQFSNCCMLHIGVQSSTVTVSNKSRACVHTAAAAVVNLLFLIIFDVQSAEIAPMNPLHF